MIKGRGAGNGGSRTQLGGVIGGTRKQAGEQVCDLRLKGGGRK